MPCRMVPRTQNAAGAGPAPRFPVTCCCRLYGGGYALGKALHWSCFLPSPAAQLHRPGVEGVPPASPWGPAGLPCARMAAAGAHGALRIEGPGRLHLSSLRTQCWPEPHPTSTSACTGQELPEPSPPPGAAMGEVCVCGGSSHPPNLTHPHPAPTTMMFCGGP